MPKRTTVLANDEIYHVYNRGIDGRDTFTTTREYKRALATLNYYQFTKPPLRLSKFLQLEKEKRKDLLSSIKNIPQKHVALLCFCLMPNHFHLLLRQNEDKGISKYLANFQNSYTRYFNLRHNRTGPLYLIQFKAVRIESDEQLIHVSRYIHLNPSTAFITKDVNDLIRYRWSSLKYYWQHESNESVCETKTILSLFGKKQVSNYRKFLVNQIDYQKKLSLIKNILIEK